MKTALLLSGGVDSSVALNLLKEQGHDVTAFYLQIWLEEELSFLGECPWKEDLDFAKGVCDKLSVNLEVLNMQKEYYDSVVEYTFNELKSGRTPSPDIMCNRNIKFGKFIEKIDPSYEMIGSGHYADIENINNRYYLKSAPDPVKDQTYFLTYLQQNQLKKIIFPIGKYNKNKVRELAQKFNLPTQNRKDSQGICFLGKIKYNDFVWFHLGEKTGDIIDIKTGKKLAEHNGYWYFTIGQRQGLGLSGGPWYVVKKDIPNNIIFISNDKFNFDVPRDEFKVIEVNWIPEAPSKSNLQVKLRHGPNKYNCDIIVNDDSTVYVKLDKKDQGIAAGQFAVFYNGDYCLGGGVIELI